MEPKNNNNNKGKEYNHVYFIESHEKDKTTNLSISKRHPGIQDLVIEYTTISNNGYFITIYSFKIFSEIICKNNKNPQKLEFSITLIDGNKDKFKKYNSNLVMYKDNFFFDFKFPNSGLFNNITPPKSLNQTLTEQFNFFLNYLKDSLKCTKESDEINDLVFSIQKYISDKDLKFDFALYLTIFAECHTKEAIQKQLDLFKIEKIREKGELSDEKIKEINNLFNGYIKEPYKNIVNVFEIGDYKMKLFSVILYFKYNFSNEGINNLYDNKDINIYLYRGLYTFTPLFKENKLPKDKIQEIINESNNFNELKYALEYSLNVEDLLQNISDNIDKFNSCYSTAKKEYKKDKKIKLRIEIGEIVTPNINDNLKNISTLIYKIDIAIKNNELEFYLIFDSAFFKKYITFHHKKDFDNLLIILDLIKFLKINYDLSEVQPNINKSINETGYSLGSDKKLNNIQILNCIKNDINYNSNSKYIKDPKCFEIFNSLNFDSIDNEFKENVKTINWINVFGKEYPNFVTNICERINHIKYFNSLFIIFNINFKNFNIPNEYKFILIKTLQHKYLELAKKTYTPEECPNFFDDSAKIIYFTDQYGENVEGFIREMNDDLPEDIIYEIYMKILTIYFRLSKTIENIIVKFILNKKNKNRESYIVLYLLERCENSKQFITTNFELYMINEDEFLQVKESENIKLLKGLINNEIFPTGGQYFQKYFNHTNEKISIVRTKIETHKITYKEIEPFFEDKNTEQNFYSRLLIIYLNDEDSAKKNYNIIKDNFNKMKKDIICLKYLLEDKEFFFKHSQKDTIVKLSELIESIENGNYNFYKDKENEINLYLSQSQSEVKQRILRKNSVVFLKIYNKQKEMHQEDELKILQESNNELNKYKPFLIGKKLNDVDAELFNIFKTMNLNKESIYQKADEIITLFGLDEKAYKSQVINSLMSLTYKDKILKLVNSLKQLIEVTKVKKGSFYNVLNIVISHLKQNEISNSIHFSIKLLQNYSIDIFDEKDNLIKLLIKIYEFPAILQFLVGNNLDEKMKENLKDSRVLDIFEQIFKFIKVFEDKDKISQMEDIELIRKIKEEINAKNKVVFNASDCIKVLDEVDNLSDIKSKVI